MSDIRTRPSVGKRCGNQTQSFVAIRERTDLTLQKQAEECQLIVSVRKDSKKYRGDCCCLRKESQAKIPIIFSGKREKKYDYPKFQYRQTSYNNNKKKHSALATTVEKYIGPRTVPIEQKMSKLQ